MRIALAAAIPILAAILQASVVPTLPVAEARPLLPVLVAASWAVATGVGEASWWAFLGGLATDLLSGGPLGAFAVAALPAVAAVGLGERPLQRPIPVLPGAAMVGLAALIASLLYVAVLALIGRPLPDLVPLVASSVGAGITTGILALAVYPAARRLRRSTEQESPF